MTLPIVYLLGLLVVVGQRELGGVLPGAATIEGVAIGCLCLLAPVLLAAAAQAAVRRGLISARPFAVPPRSLLWLSAVAVPLSLHLLFEFGAYGDAIDRIAPQSHLVRTALALLPLYLVEIPRTAFATLAEALLEVDLGSRQRQPVPRSMLPVARDVWPFVRLRVGWPLLALLPALLLGGCLDLAQLHRETYVFLLVTSFGSTVGTIAFLLLTAAVLPFWFRIAFGTRRALPEPLGTALRATARALDFRPDRVLLLPTGMRAMNAMMVGPLPVGRVLCLTDGLLATLDSRALSGVLAHEIGHARMGHPGILMLLAVMLPLLFLAPMRILDLEQLDVMAQSSGAVLLVLVLWYAVRTLARRFEHEADAASVRSLGAEPCSRALLVVSRLSLPVVQRMRGRLFSMHPDEHVRLSSMRRYEQDPEYRERFDRRGRLLRQLVVGLVAIAIAVAAWSWRLDWPFERVLLQFHSGDFVSAGRSMPALDDVPDRWRETMLRVREELDAALELAPTARDWQTATAQLSPAAWRRGQQVLLASGPAAARPWFALAIDVATAPSPVELGVYEYCEAAAAGDAERVAEVGSQVRRLGAPERLERVFRDYR